MSQLHVAARLWENELLLSSFLTSVKSSWWSQSTVLLLFRFCPNSGSNDLGCGYSVIDSVLLFLTWTHWLGPSFMYRLFRQSERRYDWTANSGTFSEIMFLIFRLLLCGSFFKVFKQKLWVCVVSNRLIIKVTAHERWDQTHSFKTGLWFLLNNYTTVKWTHSAAPRPPVILPVLEKLLIMTSVSEL